MNKNIARLLCVAAALGLGTVAKAGFVNGGFETGDFTGWTVETGYYSGGGVFNASPFYGEAKVIGNVVDPYSPFDTVASIGGGNYMAMLNDNQNGGQDMTRISQTATMLAGETDIYINWGAVLEDPGHDPSEQPFFSIVIKVNGVTKASENHNASDPGWTTTGVGPTFTTAYYNSGQFHISGLIAGDSVEVVLTVADCSLSGHAGYAFLDGIGNVSTPPPGQGVPDSGATAFLLLPVALGLAALRRKL